MPSIAWALVRDDPTLKGTEADRYVRREYGAPNVACLLSANAFPETPAEPTHDDHASEGLLRLVPQAIASFERSLHPSSALLRRSRTRPRRARRARRAHHGHPSTLPRPR